MVISKVKKFCLLLILFFATERFCHWQTGGFQLYKITAPISFEWQEPPLSTAEKERIEKILSQPFYFLGRGNQVYAFESQDGQTVLKFIKHTRQKRIPHLLASCQLAYEACPEETGLFYAHLQAKPVWGKKVTLMDKLGIAHTVDIDQTTFVLQHKANPLCQDLTPAAIDAFLAHVTARCKKGIANSDALERNYGLVHGKVIDIDIGSLNRFKGIPHKQIFYEILPLRLYLQQERPDLLSYLDKKVKDF